MTLSHWDAAYLGFADQHDDAGCGLVARAALVLCVIDQSAMRHVQDWLQRARIHARAPEARAPAALWHWAALSESVLDDGGADVSTTSALAPPAACLPLVESAAWLRRELEPLSSSLSASEKLISAQILLTYYLQEGQTHHFEDLREAVESSDDHHASSALLRARWFYTYGYAQYHISRNDEAKEAWHRGLGLCQEHGLQVTGAMLSLGFARLDVDLRRIDSARRMMATVPKGFGPDRAAFRVYREQIAGRIDLLDHLPATALSSLNKSLSAAKSARFSVAECGGCHSDRVQAMLAMAHFAEAIAELEQLVGVHRNRNREIFQCYLILIRAWDLRLQAPGLARGLLSDGLRMVDALDFRMFFRLLPSFVADLCALALSWDVERPLVHEILKARSLALAAPAHADEHWPWPLWLRLLGDDQVLLNGRDVAESTKKQPSKALQLLRYLCCQTTLSADLLDAATAVWPELVEREGMTAEKRDKLLRRNVEERIRDLRELVGQAAWVKVADSKIKLDPSAVNSDVCTRRRLLQRLRQIAEQARVPSARLSATDLARAEALTASIEALSRGELLPTYEEYEWIDEQRCACDDDLRELKSAVAAISAARLRGAT